MLSLLAAKAPATTFAGSTDFYVGVVVSAMFLAGIAIAVYRLASRPKRMTRRRRTVTLLVPPDTRIPFDRSLAARGREKTRPRVAS